MIKLYSINKKKTEILGLWRDENGKIFRDNIEIKNLDYVQFLVEGNKLFLSGEKAIFYVLENVYNKNYAYIENEKGERQTLRNCITWQEKKLRPQFIKELILQHNGVTIFKNENGYTLELWKE